MGDLTEKETIKHRKILIGEDERIVASVSVPIRDP